MKPHGVEFNAAANEPSHHRCRGASMAVMGQNLAALCPAGYTKQSGIADGVQ